MTEKLLTWTLSINTILSSVSNGFVCTTICDKRDDFDFDILNFPFLDGDRPSYGVYTRVCSHVSQTLMFEIKV